jgi:hypothetical protein
MVTCPRIVPFQHELDIVSLAQPRNFTKGECGSSHVCGHVARTDAVIEGGWRFVGICVVL